MASYGSAFMCRSTAFVVYSQLVVIVLLASMGDVADAHLSVKLRQGTIRGVLESSSFVAFKGIPYAKAPIGKLRFKAPQPADEWSGTLHADKDGPQCPQYDSKTNTVIGDEDCLFLNVYTPQQSESSTIKHPVLVLIHGGAFQHGSGSSEIYHPRVLTDRSIVVVTLNYRLGVLGFLSTTDEESPGNYGLLDQLEALRWIQQNINKFGGDVNQVTLLGHGAGAASALLHQLSPLSKGVFHQVIALSGSPVCDKYIQKNPKKWAIELGTQLDCYVVTSHTLLDCLRKNIANDLVMKANEMHVFSNYPPIFVPAVERVFMDNGDFLPDTPINLLKEGHLNRAPVMLGVSRTKGEVFHQEASKVFGHDDAVTFFEKSLPEILKVATSLNHNLDVIASAIKNEYFSDVGPDDMDKFENDTIEMYADMLVRRFNDVTAKHLSNTGWPTYMYAIERTDPSGILNIDIERNLPDELKYVFKRTEENAIEPEVSVEETTIQQIVINTWTNFIKTSMPTPNKSPELPLVWIPMNPGKIRYLKVMANATLVEGYLTKRMNFWNNEVPKVEIRGKLKEEL